MVEFKDLEEFELGEVIDDTPVSRRVIAYGDKATIVGENGPDHWTVQFDNREYTESVSKDRCYNA